MVLLENIWKYWKIKGFPILLLKTIKKPSIFQLFWDFQGSGRSEGMGMYRKPNSDLIISLKPKPLPHTRRAWDWTHLVSKSNPIQKDVFGAMYWLSPISLSSPMVEKDVFESSPGLMRGGRPYKYLLVPTPLGIRVVEGSKPMVSLEASLRVHPAGRQNRVTIVRFQMGSLTL